MNVRKRRRKVRVHPQVVETVEKDPSLVKAVTRGEKFLRDPMVSRVRWWTGRNITGVRSVANGKRHTGPVLTVGHNVLKTM